LSLARAIIIAGECVDGTGIGFVVSEALGLSVGGWVGY
jgi:hypothetical protein